jgi:hypothetical protein
VGDDYYGYVPGSVERLRQASFIARHMGDDIRHYPDNSGEHMYVDTPKPSSTNDGQPETTRRIMQNSIEMVRKRILGQSYTMVQDAANGWRDIADYLRNLSLQIRAQSDALRTGGGAGDPGWSSDGADAFMARGPGATMMSIDDWAEAAQVNYDGLTSLATTIAIHHGKMKDLYGDYQKAMVRRAQLFFFNDQSSYIWGDNPPEQVERPEDIDVDAWQRALDNDNLFVEQDQYVAALKEEEYIWTYRAQQLEYEMGQGYWQVMGHELNGGSSTVFEGPDNAQVPNGMPGMDMRTYYDALDAAANLPNTVPSIDTSNLTNLTNDTQQFKANIDQLTKNAPALDDVPGLADQTQTVPGVPDLELPATDSTAPQLDLPAPATNPGLLPVVPPPVAPPNLGDVPGAPGFAPVNTPGLQGQKFPGSADLANPGRVPGGVLGAPKGPGGTGAPSTPPAMPPKSGKILGKQPKTPQEALPQRPGAPGSPPPSLPAVNRPGQRATKRPQEPTLGRPGGPPPGTTAPVLEGRQRTGGPTPPPGAPAAPPPGTTRAGTAPPVLSNKSGRRGGPPSTVPGSPGTGGPPPQVPGRSRSGGPDRTDQHVDAPMEISQLFSPPGETGTAAPLLHRPGRPAEPVPRDVGEVPRSLRARRPVVDSPAELAARRRAAKAVQEQQERERLEENYQQIKAFMGGEEPWTVQTPGGPVMGSAERPAATPQAEPRPSLGGT